MTASQRLREGSFKYLLLPSLVWTYFVLLLPSASLGESVIFLMLVEPVTDDLKALVCVGISALRNRS